MRRPEKQPKEGNKHGENGRKRRRPGNPTLEYIFSRTKRNGECIEWVGANVRGYGRISFNGKHANVTRIVMALLGREPGDLHVCHRCDNPPCVNPDHLFLGDNTTNVRDMIAKGRKRLGNIAWGERASAGKLTTQDVAEIRMARLLGARSQDLRKLYGIAKSSFENICKGRVWVSRIVDDIVKPRALIDAPSKERA